MVAGEREYLTSDEEINVGSHYIVSDNLHRIKQYWSKYVDDGKIGDLSDELLRELLGKVVRAEDTVKTAKFNVGSRLDAGVIKCRDKRGKPHYIPVEILSQYDTSTGNVARQGAPSLYDAARTNQNNMSAAAGGGMFSNVVNDNNDWGIHPQNQMQPGGETGGDDDEAEDVEGGAGDTIEYFYDISDVQLGMRCQITDDFDRIKNQWIQCEQEANDIPDLKEILDEEVVVKGLERIIKETSDEMLIDVEDATDALWGVTIDFHTWRVTLVRPGMQFDKFGVKVGYDVLEVDGVSVASDPAKYKAILMEGPACSILLRIVERGLTFRDPYLAKDMVLAQVAFIDSPGKEMKIPWRSLLNAEDTGEDHGDFDAENFDVAKWKRKALSSADEVLIGARYKVTQDPKMMISWWEKCDLDPFAEPHMFCRSKGICREVDAEDGTIKLEWNEDGDIVFEWLPLQVCTLMKSSKSRSKPKRQPRAVMNNTAHEAAAAGAMRNRNNADRDSGAVFDVNRGELFMENAHDVMMGHKLRICYDQNRIRQQWQDTFHNPIDGETLNTITGQKCHVISIDPSINALMVKITSLDYDVRVPVRITQPLPEERNVSIDIEEDEQADYPVNRSSEQRRDPARMAAHEKAVVTKRKHDAKRENGVYAYQLSKDSDDDWGVTWDWDTWRVKAVTKGKQFHRVGIEPGWRLLQMNEYTVNERYQTYIKNCIREGMECELEFNIDKLKAGDEVKMFHVLKKEYEGLPGYIIEDVVKEHKVRIHVYATKRIKIVPVANVVKFHRNPAETDKKDPARSPPAGKRRAMDDMDIDDVQPTYYSGAQKYQGIEVDQHYRIIDDVEAIIKALDDIMPNDGLHRDEAQALTMEVVRVLEIDPALQEATVITNDDKRHHLPIFLLEPMQKPKSRTTDDLGGSHLPNGRRNKRQRDFIQNL